MKTLHLDEDTNVICVCSRIVVSKTYCVVFFFVLCNLYMLPVSLDCPFSNIY
jgi:hypothetical protein